MTDQQTEWQHEQQYVHPRETRPLAVDFDEPPALSEPMAPGSRADAVDQPAGLRHRVLGLRGVAAVALASVIVGGAGGLALGRLGNSADNTNGNTNGPGQFGRFQPGQQGGTQNGFPGGTQNGFPGQPGQQGGTQNGFPGQQGQQGQQGGTQNGVPGQSGQLGGSTSQGGTQTSAAITAAPGGPHKPRVVPAGAALPPATEPRPATEAESA